MKELKATYPSLILSHIKEFLESQAFVLDEASDLGGFHTTATGSRTVLKGPDGNKYEILVNPISKKTIF